MSPALATAGRDAMATVLESWDAVTASAARTNVVKPRTYDVNAMAGMATVSKTVASAATNERKTVMIAKRTAKIEPRIERMTTRKSAMMTIVVPAWKTGRNVVTIVKIAATTKPHKPGGEGVDALRVPFLCDGTRNACVRFPSNTLEACKRLLS